MFHARPEVVGHHHDAHAQVLAQLEQQGEDLAADRGVERGDRLVGEDQLGPERERAGDQHPLLLAAGQLVRVAQEQPLRRAQAGLGHRGRDQRRPRSALGVSGGPAVQPDPLGDRLVDGLPRVERAGGVLEHHLDPAAQGAQPAWRVVQRLALDEHLARGRRAAARSASGPAWSCPEPDSPTMARISPRCTDRSTPSRARAAWPLRVRNSTVRPRASRNGPVAAIGVGHGSRPPGCRPPGGPAPPRPAAARPSRTPATARGHRGANEQPGGRSRGSGGSPASPAGA